MLKREMLVGFLAFMVAGCGNSSGPDAVVSGRDSFRVRNLVNGEVERPVLTDDEVRVLLEKADAWKVPQPSDEARLIKIWAYSSDGADRFSLGFVEPHEPDRVMTGLEWESIQDGLKTKETQPPHDLSDVSCSTPFGAAQGTNRGLITGIHLIRRGDRETGLELIQMARMDDSGHPRSPFRSPPGESPVLMLARSCLADVINDFTEEAPDYPELLGRLERLLDDEPSLKSKATDWAVDALKASIGYQAPPAGSIESMIDDYLRASRSEGVMTGRQTMPDAERALILKGFEAVPAILKQLDSKRLTGHMMQGFNNFVSFPMQADAVLMAYLQRLANDEMGSNWLERQKGGAPDDAAVNVWWAAAEAMGERKYVAEHLIKPDKNRKGQWIVSDELRMIAMDRYPECLPPVYQKLLKSSTSSYDLAVAIAGCDAISQEEKIEILNAGFELGRDGHRNIALRCLLDLDREAYEPRLIRLLDRCPVTPTEKYWLDEDAALTRYVSRSVNAAVWDAVHRNLDRVDLGMRMEWIDGLNPPLDAPADVLRSYFKVFERYRNDPALRDVTKSEKYDGPGAGFPHDQIRMRDFVHREFAVWLKLDVESPEDGATGADWERYRQEVGLAVEAARPK